MNRAPAEQTLLNWAVVKVMNYFWRSSKLGRTFVKPKSSLTSTYATFHTYVSLRYHFRLYPPYVRMRISVFAEKPRTSKFIAALSLILP